MLLLVTLALVVASAVLLVLGFVQSALGFIYLSMVCAGVAALALFVFARLARRRGTALAGAGAAGDARLGRAPARTATRTAAAGGARRGGATAPAAAAGSDGEEAEKDDWSAFAPEGTGRWDDDDDVTGGTGTDFEETGELEPVRAGADDGDDGGIDEGYDDWGDEIVFPIEDYDDLRVAEILPLLSQLEPEELQEVRDRELAGKARATVLDRIDDRLERARRGAAAPKPSARRSAAGRATAAAAADPTASAAADPAAPAAADPAESTAAAGRPAKKAAPRRKPAGATPAGAAGTGTTRARRSGGSTGRAGVGGDPDGEAAQGPAEAAADAPKKAPARRSPGARKSS